MGLCGDCCQCVVASVKMLVARAWWWQLRGRSLFAYTKRLCSDTVRIWRASQVAKTLGSPSCEMTRIFNE